MKQSDGLDQVTLHWSIWFFLLLKIKLLKGNTSKPNENSCAVLSKLFVTCLKFYFDKLERLIYLCMPLLCSFRKPLKVDIFFLYIFLMKKKKSRYWSILLAICNPNSRLGTDSIIFLGLKNGKLLLVSHVQKLLQSVHDFSLNFPWIEIIRWHLFNFNSGFSFFIYLLIAFKLQTFVGWF